MILGVEGVSGQVWSKVRFEEERYNIEGGKAYFFSLVRHPHRFPLQICFGEGGEAQLNKIP